jgi:hypothetical protein
MLRLRRVTGKYFSILPRIYLCSTFTFVFMPVNMTELRQVAGDPGGLKK